MSPLLAVEFIQSEINRTPVFAKPECPAYSTPERENDGVIAVGLDSRARVMHAMNGRRGDQGAQPPVGLLREFHIAIEEIF